MEVGGKKVANVGIKVCLCCDAKLMKHDAGVSDIDLKEAAFVVTKGSKRGGSISCEVVLLYNIRCLYYRTRY